LSVLQFSLCRIKFESSDSENDATTDYFSGDKDFPMFSRVQTGYGCEQLIKLLMTSAVPADRTCIMRPTGASENATFVIDVGAVRFSDLKSDDMGTWKATGTKSTCLRISKGAIRCTLGSHTGGSLDYILTRRYYIHSAYQLFKRIIVDIRGMCIVCCCCSNHALFCKKIPTVGLSTFSFRNLTVITCVVRMKTLDCITNDR